MKDTDEITVCANCLCAACVQGVLMCEKWRRAWTIEKTVKELKELGLENPCYWVYDLVMKDS